MRWCEVPFGLPSRSGSLKLCFTARSCRVRIRATAATRAATWRPCKASRPRRQHNAGRRRRWAHGREPCKPGAWLNVAPPRQPHTQPTAPRQPIRFAPRPHQMRDRATATMPCAAGTPMHGLPMRAVPTLTGPLSCAAGSPRWPGQAAWPGRTAPAAEAP
jgi:hypothetical protein